ncbi:hypothetical protein H310_01148 [Aphanomyces invadans]|uniref:Uncharacterized protein n=1 Tax=Aphanomyces invadans TaxID=157072 RepID=A0A024UQM2_9STRA|nr:hypothetical protein H310_01148 [Aphanomyces invadans]ETW08604.1 hypothetical protein H310_01148 [Aphanomyces invadans]|eukprot:XP_008862409.1 hypothetical protein H310_01148 [Aphanomyces invadans]
METRSCPSMNELRGIARVMGMKYFRHLSKLELHQALQRQLHQVERAQARADSPKSKGKDTKGRGTRRFWWRKSKKKKGNATGKAEPQMLNTLDPIMLTELGPHTFHFVRPNGMVVVYNVDTLVQYILATGSFAEPETRIPFSDEVLKQLDSAATAAGFKFASVVAAQQQKGKFEQEKIKRDGLLGLERCTGEVVTEMLHIIEDDDAEEGEMRLVMDVFPSFADMFGQLKSNDPEYAAQCHKHYMEYLRGPPNRPTVDASGLFDVVLDFMKQVAAQRSSSRYGA